jgi:hypothetical protein
MKYIKERNGIIFACIGTYISISGALRKIGQYKGERL